eukprot:scaffold223170_cov14-Tisochrysis_lutea.AAC.1
MVIGPFLVTLTFLFGTDSSAETAAQVIFPLNVCRLCMQWYDEEAIRKLAHLGVHKVDVNDGNAQ